MSYSDLINQESKILQNLWLKLFLGDRIFKTIFKKANQSVVCEQDALSAKAVGGKA